jgi:S-adenosylmethionine decarboxylase
MVAKIIESAGTHVTVDAYVKDPSIFTEKHLRDLFQKLVSALDMQILWGPEFVEVPIDPNILKKSQETGIFHDEGGISGICIINTSHVSVHTWPLQKFFSMDVFSCSDYEPKIALDIIREHMEIERENIHVLHRRKPVSKNDLILSLCKRFIKWIVTLFC